MNKKYTVQLSDAERGVCQEIVKRLKGTSEKVKRAQILLKAAAAGPAWPDVKRMIAGCRQWRRGASAWSRKALTAPWNAKSEQRHRPPPSWRA